MAGRIRMRADGQAGERTAVSTLAQLGWGDARRRLIVLRLDESQWQVFQQVVLRAGDAGSGIRSTEALITACLQQWLESKG